MKRIILTCATGVMAAGAAWAEPIDVGSREGATLPPHECVEGSATTIISIAICPTGLDTEQLADVGRAICGDVVPCGVWVWDDPEALPAEAPENHDGLAQEEIVSARGVWVAEDNSFIAIDVAN